MSQQDRAPLPRPSNTAGRRFSKLWLKHSLVMSMLVCASVVLLGATEMLFSYRESVEQVGRAQAAQAKDVANSISSALGVVERQIGAITFLPWDVPGWLTLEQRRDEYARLLRIAPSVASIAHIDAEGVERLMVSRREVDRMTAGEPPSARAGPDAEIRTLRCVYSRVQYAAEYEPFLLLELSDTERNGGTTLARISLRALAGELRDALTLDGSTAYVVDEDDRIVLFRSTGLMLEKRRVGTLPHVTAAGLGPITAMTSRGLHGGQVIASSVDLPGVNWRVFVEQPRADALAPVYDTLARTAAFTIIGLLLAIAGAFYLANRLTRPIVALNRAAAALAGGNLATRIDVKTGDELEDLGGQFNHMARSLEDSYLHLEDKVAQKTLELELANRHKSEFLANMSHELRTPLNAIIGFSEVLSDEMFGTLNAKQMEYALDIHGSGQHLLSLINDILDLSKIEAGRLDLELAAFDVHAAVANAATLLRERCQRQQLKLSIGVSPELDTWTGDPRRFKQVLVNLLSNAVKFTPAGGTITVSAHAAGDRLEVSVSDTGIGIADGDLQLIFEPFRQARAEDSNKAEGTGLGLSLVRQLVELHGGEIQVRSRSGMGSTFTFWLPKGNL